jgi:hypothetical protein
MLLHRIRGRPRNRWIEDIEEDIQALGIRGWRKLSEERIEWRRITEKAMGCNTNKRRRMLLHVSVANCSHLQGAAVEGVYSVLYRLSNVNICTYYY